MSGYYVYSMSNNAIAAYSSGEKPLSKWSKAGILSAVRDARNRGEIELSYDVELLNKLKLSVLQDVVLSYSGWHHTSSRYNRTDFYCLDYGKLERLSADTIKGIAGIKEHFFLNKVNFCFHYLLEIPKESIFCKHQSLT